LNDLNPSIGLRAGDLNVWNGSAEDIKPPRNGADFFFHSEGKTACSFGEFFLYRKPKRGFPLYTENSIR
jgi:hypothetical protein